MKYYLLIIFLISNINFGQVANLKLKNYQDIKNAFGIEIEVFESIEFNINGKKFKIVENLNIDIPVNKKEFDTISYSYFMKGKYHDGLALAKFKPNKQYFLSPCTCCGIFMISSENAERGIVRFKNNSKQNLVGITGELDTEVIKSKSISKYFFSSVSMNCGFRPTEIRLYTSDFMKKSEYEDFELNEEKFSIDFLFIDGEKITIDYNENKSKVIFDGFLNEGEIKKYYKNYEN